MGRAGGGEGAGQAGEGGRQKERGICGQAGGLPVHAAGRAGTARACMPSWITALCPVLTPTLPPRLQPLTGGALMSNFSGPQGT